MSNFRLRVWFKDIDGSHDGYCSDAENPTYTTEYSDEIVDIPNDLSPETVDEDGTLNNLDCLISLEYREYHGSGYCGVYSTRKVIKAKIIDTTTAIKAKWMRALSLDESDEEVDD
ncbi:MAG: hypothetical protein PHG66_01880 [Candidatus Colwellbacteria bacterium]|nr:hypothetical protein [Candidatus Colwellbacteria bacterium]